jgi:hypothetical protein
VAAYASDRLEWVNHFNNKSIDHHGIHLIVKKVSHACPKDDMKVPLVDAGTGSPKRQRAQDEPSRLIGGET